MSFQEEAWMGVVKAFMAFALIGLISAVCYGGCPLLCS